MFVGGDGEHVGYIAVERPARLDADRIHQDQFGKSPRVDGSDFSGSPPAHGEAHQDGISQVQMVD